MSDRFVLIPQYADGICEYLDVTDTETRTHIGRVRRYYFRSVAPDRLPEDDWTVESAGPGIPGTAARFPTSEAACAEILRLREAAYLDGPLTVDETGLRRLDRDILDFEGQWWTFPGAKAAAVLDQFDLPPTRYYQILNRLLDDPAAEAYAPLTVHRLRRLRDRRRTARGA